MGEVYRARDTRLERTVAIKVLRSHLSESADSKQRFERDARALSTLQHPHICVLYDIGYRSDSSGGVKRWIGGFHRGAAGARSCQAAAPSIGQWRL